MDDPFDAAEQSAHARQLQQLARDARATYERRLVEDGARLGTERDQIARRVQGAEHEKAAAKVQAQRELKVAAEADRKAAELERKATAKPEWNADAEELREEAAQHRARAEIARQRAHTADEEIDRLEWTIAHGKKSVADLEAQMRSTDRMKAIEGELDELDWHARNAVETATVVQRIADLERRADEATARGETALAAKLAEETKTWRDGVNVVSEVRARSISEIDTAQLASIGIEIPVEVLRPLGEATAPTDTDPTATDPTFEDSTTNGEAPSAEAPAATAPSTDGDIVTGESGPTTDAPTSPVEEQGESVPTPAPVAEQAPADPPADDSAPTSQPTSEPEMPVDTTGFDDPDSTSFIEPEEPTVAEHEDVLVDTF